MPTNAQMAKNLPVAQETRVLSLGWEDPLEEEMAPHFSILFFYFIFKLYIIVLVLPNIKMNPPQVYISVFLPGKSHGQRSLEGYSPWGRKGSDMTEQLTLTFTCPLEK